MLGQYCIVLWTSITTNVIFSKYHLFWTDIQHTKDSLWEYDCLYRGYFPLATSSDHVHEIVPYCVRSNNILKGLINESIVNGNKYTFVELKARNITSQQLYFWSGPIDVVERYAIYLKNPEQVPVFEQTFYNCTLPWFGVLCEFSFNTTMDFTKLIQEIFNAKTDEQQRQGDIEVVTNYSCYELLTPCDRRGPKPSCLDWREICDGKTDCMNNGIDEQGCEELEVNECGPDEYRCHNGLCVLINHFHDLKSNPDCLDGSDEPPLVTGCVWDPSFRCEERTCRYALEFSCGDGQCTKGSYLTDYYECNNERDAHLTRTVVTRNQMSFLSEECWKAMMCATSLATIEKVDCECLKRKCNDIIQSECVAEFLFPSEPVLFGHVYFIFQKNETIESEIGLRLPNNICYNNQLCPFLSHTKIINNLTCRHYREFDLGLNYNQLNRLIKDLSRIFRACSMLNYTLCHRYPALFHCDNNSFKCISHHRRYDGVADCTGENDEKTNGSCSVDHPHRFRCSSSSDVCVAPVVLQDKNPNCPDGEDEAEPESQIMLFPTLCDRFQDRNFELINDRNESDETDCEYWQCNNAYNRCDGIYNCLNEADEANCSHSLCPPLYHPCVSPVTNKFICLPIDQVNDGREDCIGASDERQYCRDNYASKEDANHRFKCRNDSMCLSPGVLCEDEPDCPYGDDEQFCESYIKPDEQYGRCGAYANNNRTLEENLVCNLTDEFKRTYIYFSLRNAYLYPAISTTLPMNTSTINMYDNNQTMTNELHRPNMDLHRVWYCYRGILVYRNTFNEKQCLCPPSYYGDKCQYQSQRVSLTVQFQREYSLDKRAVFHVVILLMDDLHQIHSHDHIIYAPARDCDLKHNVYLLYRARPKDLLRNYSIRIDVFRKKDITYYTSWYLTIPFIFLPVNRLSTRVTIPAQTAEIHVRCPLMCIHGHCTVFGNTKNFFCRCDEGWSGSRCNISHRCDCASDSLCIGSVNNRSICVCQSDKFGPKCLLKSTACQLKDACRHGGLCVPSDSRLSEHKYSCLCREGFSGSLCEIINTKITVSFKGVSIPQSILAHVIEVSPNAHPMRVTLFAKVPFDSFSATLFIAQPFHMIFVEFADEYYLAFVQETYILSKSFQTDIIPSHRCASVDELFNKTILQYHSLRRIKLYHKPCQIHSDLTCFHDEKFMCLCNLDRHANCFEFDHNMHYNCFGQNYCKNDGKCFQDDPRCPVSSMCVCAECYYGRQCQLSTKGLDLSLDSIIGYAIVPNVTLQRQPTVIKVSVAATIVMTTVGLTNGILSVITFHAKIPRGIGCDVYLLTSAVTSILTISTFTLKYFFVLTVQMALISDKTFLHISCILTDFFLKILVNSGSWLNGCIAVERALIVVLSTRFDKQISKRVAKWVPALVFIFVILTSVHDPIFRRIIHDDEEQRTWCIVTYPVHLQVYTSTMNTLHVLIPFFLNLASALVIILMTARKRSTIHKNFTYWQHLRLQFQQHIDLLASSCIIVLLVLPRLMISILVGCMKSTRDPWLFLVGYFISFLPHILTFPLFVAPSKTYKKEFFMELERIRKKTLAIFTNQLN